MRFLGRVTVFAMAASTGFFHACDQAGGEQPTEAKATAAPLDVDQQIMVRAQLLEVSRDKMRKLGCDFHSLNGGRVDLSTPEDIVGLYSDRLVSSAGLTGFLDALCQNGVAKALTAPTIAATDGRTASLSIGGSVALSGSHKDRTRETFIGTRFQVTPTLVGSDRVRLDLNLKWSEAGQDTNPGKATPSRVHRHEVDTTLVARLGETCFLAGVTSKPGDPLKGEATTLVLAVKPVLITNDREANQSRNPTAENAIRK